MLKFYVKGSDLLTRLREDKDGVVSFEYIIVAACVIAGVSLAFGAAGGAGISAALTGGLAGIVATFNAVPGV
jgi:pilus assembly protein Flp/PilA